MIERKDPTFGEIGTLDLSDAHSRRSEPPVEQRPRRPWLALLLGMLCAPAAFAYVGRYGWCIALYAGYCALSALLGINGWIQHASAVWVFFALCILIQIFGVFAPWVVAREQTRRYRTRWYNRWYLYPFLILALWIPLGYAASHRPAMFRFDLYGVPSAGMAPTIADGERIVADARPARVAEIHRDDVVVHAGIEQPNALFIRRVIGLPGEKVQIASDGVRINGKLQAEPFAQGTNVLAPNWMRFASVELKADEYFLMGDNRTRSFDSRTEGPYPRAAIRATVSAIWYSPDPARIGPVH